MRLLVQRVNYGSVTIQNEKIAEIQKGYVVLVGIEKEDTKEVIDRMATKLLQLRVMADEAKKMNKNITEVKGSILAVSQFTLCADTHKGNRPSFLHAKDPDEASVLFDRFVEKLSSAVLTVTGKFGHYMDVVIHNDGPVTIMLDSKE